MKIYKIDKNVWHKTSIVICLKCFKRWVAVRPMGTKLINLECKNCGQGFVIETGEEIEKN